MNVVAGLLNISTLQGMQSMQHAPKDELEKLCNERRMDLEMLSTRIKSLLHRLERKEHLLQGYEKDLSKLRYWSSLILTCHSTYHTINLGRQNHLLQKNLPVLKC